jgi:hypothetical protein
VPATVRPRLYVTDTLGNPDQENEYIPQILKPLAESRRQANAVKRAEPITVVIGNPPYKEKAKGRGGWVEDGSANTEAPLQRWIPPPVWGVGAHTKHLRNLYIYFWRWATWKVFGDGAGAPQAQSAEPDSVGRALGAADLPDRAHATLTDGWPGSDLHSTDPRPAPL